MSNKNDLMLAAALGMGYRFFDNLPDLPNRKLKKCLFCGAEHEHHNSFCSANCCKDYRQRKSWKH